jgi:hypothetical protein
MMLSLNLALLLLQACPAILASLEPAGFSGHIANDDAYSQLQYLFDSARLTSLDALQKRSGSCSEDNVKIRREWSVKNFQSCKFYSKATTGY